MYVPVGCRHRCSCTLVRRTVAPRRVVRAHIERVLAGRQSRYSRQQLLGRPDGRTLVALPSPSPRSTRHLGRRPSLKVFDVTRIPLIAVSYSQIPLRYLVADRSEAGRTPAASWNLAYYLAR